MEHTLNRVLTLFTVFGLIVLSAIMLTQVAFGSAPSGLPATLATSSPYVLASRTVTTLVATSTSCSARVISSTDKQLMLTFSDYNNTSPGATYGHMQSASTTVVYDSGLWGCGLMKVWADGATNITVTETR